MYITCMLCRIRGLAQSPIRGSAGPEGNKIFSIFNLKNTVYVVGLQKCLTYNFLLALLRANDAS